MGSRIATHEHPVIGKMPIPPHGKTQRQSRFSRMGRSRKQYSLPAQFRRRCMQAVICHTMRQQTVNQKPGKGKAERSVGVDEIL